MPCIMKLNQYWAVCVSTHIQGCEHATDGEKKKDIWVSDTQNWLLQTSRELDDAQRAETLGYPKLRGTQTPNTSEDQSLLELS